MLKMLLTTIIVVIVLCADLSLELPTTTELREMKYPLTRGEAFEKLKDKSDFVFDFYHPRDIDIIKGADAGLTVRAKGTNFPMLLNNDLSMSLSKVNACGIVLPHIHPRSAQIYYIIQGKFEFGFIQENGAHYVQQTIEEGQGTIFPQGSVHYFINNECEEASLVAVANSDDPGRIDVVDALFNVLPESIVTAALGGQKTDINKNQIQTVDPAKGTEECRRRCQLP